MPVKLYGITLPVTARENAEDYSTETVYSCDACGEDITSHRLAMSGGSIQEIELCNYQRSTEVLGLISWHLKHCPKTGVQ
jgi:ribosomal protein L32